MKTVSACSREQGNYLRSLFTSERTLLYYPALPGLIVKPGMKFFLVRTNIINHVWLEWTIISTLGITIPKTTHGAFSRKKIDAIGRLQKTGSRRYAIVFDRSKITFNGILEIEG